VTATRLSLLIGIPLALFATVFAISCSGSGGHNGKWRVALYGDSLSVEAGPYVARSLRKGGKAIVVSRAVSGTAPCDWRPVIQRDIERGNADFAIVEVYGNNASQCQLKIAGGSRPETDSRKYWSMYRKDLKTTIGLFPESTKVMLVAAPAASVDRASGKSHKAQMLRLMKNLADQRDGAFVVDAGIRVEEPAGHFTRVMKCARPGNCTNHPSKGLAIVRAHDGLHFCPPMMIAKTELLKHCPVVAYGAWRFGLYQAVKAARAMGIKAYPPPLART